jgi:hypothetical protein
VTDAERLTKIASLLATAKDTAIGAEVESFLERHAMPATKFGRLAARDPRFVPDLRIGRTPRHDTGLRIRAWMQGYDAAKGGEA